MKPRMILIATSFCLLWQCLLAMPVAEAQGIFDQLRNEVRREVQGAINRGLPQQSQPQNPRQPQNPVQPPRARASSNSIPSESGRINNPGAGFTDRGGFAPPRGNPPNFSVPSQTIPQQTFQQQTIPQRTFQQSTIPQQTYIPSNQQSNQGMLPSSGSSQGSSYSEVPQRSAAFSGQPIKLQLPKTMPQSATYQLIVGSTPYSYTMRPGESQTFNEEQLWLIRFQEGGSSATYRLRGGRQYEFEVDSQGRISLHEVSSVSFPEPPKRG